MKLLLLDYVYPGDSYAVGVFSDIAAIESYLQSEINNLKKTPPSYLMESISDVLLNVESHGALNETGKAYIMYNYKLKPSRSKGFRTNRETQEQTISYEWRTVEVDKPFGF